MKTKNCRLMTLTISISLFFLFSFTPSASGTFGDVPDGYWAYDYINVIYNEQITAGCGAGNYCPGNNVTREQMAAFIVRAVEGGQFYEGICAGPSPFSDILATTPFCRNIERLVALGITSGCGPTTYCPGNNVTREQMAAFLYRGFLRHLYGTAPDIMAKLAILDSQVTNAQITDEQFLTGFLEALGQIETHGISLFLQYLETNVSGFPINYPAPAGREAAESMTIQETIDAITQSQAYQMLEAFISSVIGSLTPEPASTLLQLGRPETFVALSAIQVRSHIDKSFYNESSITFDQYQDCLGILSQNPYEAERTLLQYQGKPIPAWLMPAPVTSGCIRNCPPPPPPPGYCGDGICAPALGESTLTCPGDCPPPPPPPGYCGDGTCDPGLGESTITCPGDCPLVCGDGFCNIAGGELQSCPTDCPQNQCCAQTNGCPSETPYDCPGSCCCCGWGQTCCQTPTGWTCCGG
jgi:hypothetical protein